MKVVEYKPPVYDYGAVLDERYGSIGTPERQAFDEEAYAFYTGQILLQARKQAKVTQSQLAELINSSKSYISRIENGLVNPTMSTFYRIVNALGMRVEIVLPIS